MQFVNIVVHSVDDMNFRVHLQYEFTQLGIDDFLEKLRHHESEELQVIDGYLIYEEYILCDDDDQSLLCSKYTQIKHCLYYVSILTIKLHNLECMSFNTLF